MTTVHISWFDSLRDNLVKPIDVEWDDLVGLLCGGHVELPEKALASMFNGARYVTPDELPRGMGYALSEMDGRAYTLRRQHSITQVELLILDYDGTLSIAEARERFKSFEYVGYTSFSHLESPGIEKFRIVFPLAKPIPVQAASSDMGHCYDDLLGVIQEFAGLCDPVISNPNQAYYFPTTHPARAEVVEAWHNKGEILDWRAWEPKAAVSRDQRSAIVSAGRIGSSSARQLDPNQVFEYKRGTVIARDVSSRIQGVRCPFHDDKTGTEFLNRFEDSKVIVFHCKRCGTYTLFPQENIEHKDKSHESRPHDLILPERIFSPQEQLLVFESARTDGKVFVDAGNRQRVIEQLKDIKREILKDSGLGPHGFIGYKSHIVFMPEGAGKSRLALDIVFDAPFETLNGGGQRVKRRRQVIFACKSWNQVFKKHAELAPLLAQHGLRAQIAYSFEARLQKRFQVPIKRTPARPFTTGDVLRDETIEDILRKHPNLTRQFVELCWNIIGRDAERFVHLTEYDDEYLYSPRETEPPASFDTAEPGFPITEEDESVSPAILFTTFAQLRLLQAKHDYVRRDWIVWFDDPDVDDLIDITPKPIASRAAVKEQAGGQHIRTIDGTDYLTRPPSTELGHAVKWHRCVYTTTENLTRRLIEKMLRDRREKFLVHNKMEGLEGGTITLLGTKAVQKRFDAVIPLIARRLNKQGIKTELIADGLAAEFNHSNSKGQNALNCTNLIVELSIPHPVQVKTICDALGLDFSKKRDEITKELMLDRLHQAIGRNSGYRYKGFECVVLVDSSKHSYLKQNCRYALQEGNSVVIDRTQKMARCDTRLDEQASPMAKAIEALLNNIHNYLSDDRKVKPDINHVVKAIKNDSERLSYVARLLGALTSISNVRFDIPALNTAQDHFSQKFLSLGAWLLEEHVPDHLQDRVIREYGDMFADNPVEGDSKKRSSGSKR